MTYDGGDLVATQTPVGGVFTRFVDAAGRTVRLTDPNGSVTQFEYNAHDQVTKTVDPLGGETMRDLTAYVRGLPPVPGSASNEGRHLFERVLCSRCHTGVTGTANVTGNSPEVRAYTDLLIHEMGSRPPHGEQDSRTELRTPALWGIAAIGPPFMHDGAAATVEEAILRHGGEAERSRRLFTSLSTAEKQQLLRFVQTR